MATTFLAHHGHRRTCRGPIRPLRCTLAALGCTLLCLLLVGCSSGIYGSIGIAGPSVDLGPVKVNTGVHLGRWL